MPSHQQLDRAVREIGNNERLLHSDASRVSPYRTFTRQQWAALSPQQVPNLEPAAVSALSGIADPIDFAEVEAIYAGVSDLILVHYAAHRQLAADRAKFLGISAPRAVPFVIGIAGSVAVGKSSIARVLQKLLSSSGFAGKVDLITTDGFLLPNAELEARGLMQRKGFPESYDRQALLSFLAQVKAGSPKVLAPTYSHVTYDIVPDHYQSIESPQILLVEGINVLQPPRLEVSAHQPSIAVSDYFDFSIFIDADHEDIESWYVGRFLKLRSEAFSDRDSYFVGYADLDDVTAENVARQIWNQINLVNFVENIRPTRGRADLIIHKAHDHRVDQIRLRKL